ncbi:MAG: NADPH:quinone oxidoreductase family protein [Bryobacterales bacterium]
MKAWQVTKLGSPEEMTLAEVSDPVPGPGEVLVANRAAGVNFFDTLQIAGKYQVRPAFPFTPGGELAGAVEALGEGVEGLAVGDRVMGSPMGGGYAQRTLVPAERVLPIPEGMTFEQAAGFPIVYQTSWFALNERGKLQPGETLLVHAGASGVGVAAIEIGKAMGARVFASASTPEKRDFCLRHGAEAAIDYVQPDWFEQVKALTGGIGADVIYDPVGGDVFDLSTKCIAPEGRLLVVGFASGRIPSLPANRLLLKNFSAVGVYWGRQADEHPGYLQQAHARLSELFLAGKLDPPVHRAFPLDRAPEALAEVSGRRVLGKVVLTI